MKKNKSKLPDYQVTGIGLIPDDLSLRVSQIHAQALMKNAGNTDLNNEFTAEKPRVTSSKSIRAIGND